MVEITEMLLAFSTKFGIPVWLKSSKSYTNINPNLRVPVVPHMHMWGFPHVRSIPRQRRWSSMSEYEYLLSHRKNV